MGRGNGPLKVTDVRYSERSGGAGSRGVRLWVRVESPGRWPPSSKAPTEKATPSSNGVPSARGTHRLPASCEGPGSQRKKTRRGKPSSQRRDEPFAGAWPCGRLESEPLRDRAMPDGHPDSSFSNPPSRLTTGGDLHTRCWRLLSIWCPPVPRRLRPPPSTRRSSLEDLDAPRPRGGSPPM